MLLSEFGLQPGPGFQTNSHNSLPLVHDIPENSPRSELTADFR